MSDAKTFNLKRKQDGAVVGPVTEAQAKDIAGYPDDFEKLDVPSASRDGYGKKWATDADVDATTPAATATKGS